MIDSLQALRPGPGWVLKVTVSLHRDSECQGHVAGALLASVA